MVEPFSTGNKNQTDQQSASIENLKSSLKKSISSKPQKAVNVEQRGDRNETPIYIKKQRLNKKNKNQNSQSHEQLKLQILNQISGQQEEVVRKKKQKHVLGPEDEFLEYVYGEDGVRRKRVRKMVYEDKEITIQEVQEIKKAFDMFDKDQSNNIDTAELKDAMRALGVQLDKEDLSTLMEKADKDGSGAIDFEEFLSLMVQRIQFQNPKLEISKAFRMYDDDEGGTIDFNNLRKVATDLEEDIYIDDEEIEKMIKLADTKGQGSVDFDDFMALMKKAKLFD